MTEIGSVEGESAKVGGNSRHGNSEVSTVVSKGFFLFRFTFTYP